MVSQQILLPKGRRDALIYLFTELFGYAAIGYDSENTKFGVDENTGEITGFKELLVTQVDGYEERPKLIPYDANDTISIDQNGKIIVFFEVLLDTEIITPKNINPEVPINQIGIVNNSESNSLNTNFLLAASFTEFRKTADIAISFIIEAKM